MSAGYTRSFAWSARNGGSAFDRAFIASLTIIC
jgi:hypothetical protein